MIIDGVEERIRGGVKVGEDGLVRRQVNFEGVELQGTGGGKSRGRDAEFRWGRGVRERVEVEGEDSDVGEGE